MSQNKVTIMAAAAVILALVLTHSARSDNPAPLPPINIAIANPAAIFQNIRETQDIILEIQQDKKALEDQITQKKMDLAKMQQELTYVNSSSPDYDAQNQQLTDATIKFDAWEQETELDLSRRWKNNIKKLFDEIEAAVATVAQSKGINLVIADQEPLIPDDLDNVNFQTLQAMMAQRTVLYSDQSRDISRDVEALLDKNYLSRTQSQQTPGEGLLPTTPSPDQTPAVPPTETPNVGQ
ncbi:MAG TPA: OmpH family outer membrane protein [Tepidisphaeraceae bacterium]|nr:OmpH family outer membrane protein [Tepidisphaeraceae bacterium]